jgi:hypothetical protein
MPHPASNRDPGLGHPKGAELTKVELHDSLLSGGVEVSLS